MRKMRKKDLIDKICEHFGWTKDDKKRKEAESLYEAARRGGEMEKCGGDLEKWFEERFKPNTVILKAEDYIFSLVHALKLAPTLAATDYGTSRQRDLGQLWTDTQRGFLGELAFKKFLERFCEIDEIFLDYSKGGSLQEYLPSDIKEVKLTTGKVVKPAVKISVKATKFRGLWLDVPGAQIEHSDAFVLVKVGVTREHFVAFLKKISFIKDKLLPRAEEIRAIEPEEAQKIYESLPEFSDIPCYIAGFLDKELRQNPPNLGYNKKKGESGAEVYRYVGLISENKPENIPEDVKIDGITAWTYRAIGKFSQQKKFIANVGSLKYKLKDWQELIKKMIGKP